MVPKHHGNLVVMQFASQLPRRGSLMPAQGCFNPGASAWKKRQTLKGFLSQTNPFRVETKTLL